MSLIDNYQTDVLKTARYPKQHAFVYLGLGMAAEAGEVANIVKKVIRDDWGVLSAEKRDQLLDELGDVLWYVAVMAYELGFSMDDIAAHNLAKLFGRYASGTHK